MNAMWTGAVAIARNVAHSPGLLFLAVAGVVVAAYAARIAYLNNREN